MRVDLRGEGIYTATTDSSGGYTIANVKEGKYEATFLDLQERFYPTISGNHQRAILIPEAAFFSSMVKCSPPERLGSGWSMQTERPSPALEVATGYERNPHPDESTDKDGWATFSAQRRLLLLLDRP